MAYPPQQGEEQPSGDRGDRAVFDRTQRIGLDVSDARDYSDRIGVERDPSGIVIGSFLTEDNIAIWAEGAIATELEALGYDVVTGPDATSGGYDRLVVELTRLYCDIYMFYDGEVTLRAMLQPMHGEAFNGEFPAKVNTGFSWAGTSRGTGESLARAMQRSARTMLATLGFVPRT